MKALAVLVVLAPCVITAQTLCSTCHARETAGFSATPMARSFGLVSTRAAERFTKPVQFLHSGTGRRYRVYPKGKEFLIEEFIPGIYSDVLQAAWWIGSGNHARSFLMERRSRLYQAPITYYSQPGRWDMSPGYDGEGYVGFTRRVTSECLYCHTNGHAQPAAIGCERCHGPGEQHSKQAPKGIVNPAKLSPLLRDQICEQCHLQGASRVVHQGKRLQDYRPGERLDHVLAAFNYRGVSPASRVTSHPEQLKQSRCRQQSSGRLWCGSCHEVHRTIPKAERAAFFRARCLTCHKKQDCTQPQAPESDCTSCHMPKMKVVESAHVALTNHSIPRRAAPTGEATQPSGAALKPLLELPDDPVKASRLLGFALLDVAGSTGSRDLAAVGIRTLEPLAGTAGSDADFWENLGEAYLRTGRQGEAELAFQRAINLRPGSPPALYALGFLRQRDRRFAEAIAFYQRAVTSDPEMTDAWKNLASALFSVGHASEAVKALKEVLQLEPGNLEVRREMSRVP